jgi:Bacterial capsule synthesis protein PGA_cap
MSWRWLLLGLVGVVCLGVQAQQVSLVFAGDTTLDDDPGALIERGGDPLAGFAPLFAQADIRIANLECVVATTGQAGHKNYTFRAHPRVLPVLKRHLDGVTLANNHSGDYGREAFAQMLGLLRQTGLAQAGGGMNLAEAHTPWIVERHGLRIAILSYNEFMPRSFEADHDAPGIAWSEDEQVVEDIRKARSVHRADVVIPFMHWGWAPACDARHRALPGQAHRLQRGQLRDEGNRQRRPASGLGAAHGVRSPRRPSAGDPCRAHWHGWHPSAGPEHSQSVLAARSGADKPLSCRALICATMSA